MRRQIEHLTGLHDNFVAHGVAEFGELLQVWIRVVHLGMAGRFVLPRQQGEILTLIRMGQNVASTTAQDDNGIPAGIKVILGNDTLHSETTMNTLLLTGIAQIELAFFRLEEGQFVIEISVGAIKNIRG
jgi:hypothetical protein